MIEESEWLQKRAAAGKTKSRDLAEIAVLKEHQICVEAMTERYGKSLWRNGGSIPELLRSLALAITRTNRQMIETIEKARKKARRNKRRRGDTPPPRRDSRGRTRSARSQASCTPEEDQVQGREISYSPLTEEDDVQERTITQDVPYIEEETKRNKELKRNKEIKRSEETEETVDAENYEDMQRNRETQRSVEMERDIRTDRNLEDEPMRTDEPTRLEDLRDPEEPMDARESEPRRGTRRPKRLCDSQDPQEPERMSRLERDESTPREDHRQEGAEALLAMAGMIIEPIPPKKMYRRDRNKRERDKEAQVNETEASLEANYGDTSHESINDSLELLNIEEMVQMLTAQDTLGTIEDQV